MPIGDKFTGLDMEELIGKPLKAADEAKKRLDQSTAEFIKEVGFDDQHTKCPLLSLVPIPNLHIDDINVEFEMEIKDSKTDEND